MKKKRRETLTYVSLGICLMAGTAFLYKSYSIRQMSQDQIQREFPKTPHKTQGLNNKKPSPSQPWPLSDLKEIQKNQIQEKGFVAFRRKAKLQSNLVQRRFHQQAFIQIDWPESMDYIEVDIEDDMKSIYGYNHFTGEELTAFARPALTTMAEVKLYLRNYADLVPNLEGRKISQLSTPRGVKGVDANPHIGNIQWMKGRLDGDKPVYFAIVNRQDNKGSYIFVFSGSSLESNDGYVEKIYESLKIIPTENDS